MVINQVLMFLSTLTNDVYSHLNRDAAIIDLAFYSSTKKLSFLSQVFLLIRAWWTGNKALTFLH